MGVDIQKKWSDERPKTIKIRDTRTGISDMKKILTNNSLWAYPDIVIEESKKLCAKVLGIWKVVNINSIHSDTSASMDWITFTRDTEATQRWHASNFQAAIVASQK